MAIAVALLLPYVLITKNFKPRKKNLILAILCGILFGCCSWNIAIQESSATQASLLTNHRFGWVYYLLCIFKKQTYYNFWIGTTALFGMAMSRVSVF
jgi:drug/metabolite transporter (DMT)-like permease